MSALRIYLDGQEVGLRILRDSAWVWCTKSSSTGSAQWHVGRGMFVSWEYQSGGGQHFGRVVAVAQEDRRRGDRWLVCIELSDCGTFGYQRFVRPQDVRQAHVGGAFLEWFAGEGFMRTSPEVTLARDKHGSLCDTYIKARMNPDGSLMPLDKATGF
jgi:hypothetical protein